MSRDASKLGSPWWPADHHEDIPGYAVDDIYPEPVDRAGSDEYGLHTIRVEPSYAHRPWQARCVDCGWRHLAWTRIAAVEKAEPHGHVIAFVWEWVCPWCNEFVIADTDPEYMDQIHSHLCAEHDSEFQAHPIRQAEAWRKRL